jgi:P27 family predicted phage terminase small subunit
MSTPTCPEHLGELARLEWNRIAAEHATADPTTLAAYCAAYGRWVDAEQKINEFGVVIKTKGSDKAQTNPYVAVAEQSLNTMHKFLSLLNHTDSKTVF